MFSVSMQTSLIMMDEELHSDSAVVGALRRFIRDMQHTLTPSTEERTDIRVDRDPSLSEEGWRIDSSRGALIVRAGGGLGAVYALSYVSQIALGVQPLWYWLDQEFTRIPVRYFPHGTFASKPAAFRFRGWFLNDEVLLGTWTPNGKSEEPWEMAFEALLRLGGNLVIPGTDKNSKRYAALAASMGLWLTHHHAEPLGAEMFGRAYPGLEPSYVEHPDLFERLWRQAVERQKEMRVVWNIGFRGQGDRPFWDDDPEFDTDEKRGALLTSIMEKQFAIVSEQQTDPIVTCNLYGESVELFDKGHVKLPPNTIRIWGDNGYGKMVSRRQGLDNPRYPALPSPSEHASMHGMYYHVSFYDLQAANHITMTPVSLDFMKRELEEAFSRGVDDLIVVNVSNVRPHAVPAAMIAGYWQRGEIDVNSFLTEFAAAYSPGVSDQAVSAYRAYSEAAVLYGTHEDEKAGDQFYTYTLRALLSQWLKQDLVGPVPSLGWFSADPFPQVVKKIRSVSAKAVESYRSLVSIYDALSTAGVSAAGAPPTGAPDTAAFRDTMSMYARLYRAMAKTLLLFTDAAHQFLDKRFFESFLSAGNASEENEEAVRILRNWERGKWVGFYANDCLTDVSENTYLLRVLMEHIRAFADGPEYYRWQRQYTYSRRDRGVVLVTNWEKHMSAWELYQAYRRSRRES